MSDFLPPIARGFGEFLRPIEVAFGSPEEIELLLIHHGWDARVAQGDVDAIRSAFAIFDLLEAVLVKLDVLINGSDAQRGQAVVELVQAAKAVVDRLDSLGAVATAGLPAPFNQAGFWNQLSQELLDDLIITYLETNQRFFFATLHLLGIIRFERVTPAAGADPAQVPYIRSRLVWDDLGKILTGPADQFKGVYKWGAAGENFRHVDLVRALERAALAFNFSPAVGPPRQSLASALDPGAIATQNINELEIPLVDGVSYSDYSCWKIGAVVLPVPDPVGSNSPPKGLLISPLLQGQLSTTQYFSKAISLRLTGAFQANGAITALVFPDRASIQTNIPDATFAATLTMSGDPDQPWVLIGAPGAPRIELDGFLVEYGVQGRIDDPEIFFTIGTGEEKHKVRLVVSMDEGDAFLQKLLGDGFKVEAGGNLHWSSKQGLSFDGSAALDLAKHIHLTLGPLTIDTLYVQVRMGDGNSLDVGLGVGVNSNLGPLALVVDNIGLRASLIPTQPGQRGAFGSLDVGFGFKPPKGAGLSLDAGVVAGGGYLYIDTDRGEYAGALELVVADFLSLHAIGLITTKMPDGTKGFSLLIIITAEFGAGIQLGFGFTLIGVGGLVGLNRTMLLQPLMDGVRSGAINDILFPQDVIANAARIISDLRAIFPPQEGIFLIGPMAKLGWGTPTLVSLSLGVIIEIPGNIAILGILKLALPTAEEPILNLQVNFAGAIEFDKKRLYFFASLFDSHLLFITIEGEMGVLFAFGADANFVMSVGGFHPQFNPPPLPFPTPKRIQLDIINESYARIRCDGYFAVTTNTAQFGSHSEYFFGFSSLTVQGHSDFDALFQFSPFQFTVTISTQFSVNVFGAGVFGVNIDLLLEGPTPWHAHGTASIKILFVSVGIGIDFTWGDSRDTTLPPIAVMPLLTDEFQKQNNWRAVLPTNSNLLVSLRKLDSAETNFVLHPVGVLHVSQKAVPLELTLDKVGNQKPSDANYFELDISSGAFAKTSDVSESFAPAQFKEFDGATKLSQPAYEPEPGGIELSAAGAEFATGTAVTRIVRYDLTVIDTKWRRFQAHFYVFVGSLFAHFLGGASVTRNVFSANRKGQVQPFSDRVTVNPETFAVSLKANNKVYSASSGSFTSQVAANDFMNSETNRDPTLRETLHVLPHFEVAP